jgi:hypothetical protein
MDDVSKILDGVLTPEQARALLNSFDRKGLNPITFAALQGAKASDKLLSLLQLLEPPTKAEESQLDQVVKLLEQIAASQIRIEETQGRQERMLRQIGSALAGRANTSPRRSGTAVLPSKH